MESVFGVQLSHLVWVGYGIAVAVVFLKFYEQRYRDRKAYFLVLFHDLWNVTGLGILVGLTIAIYITLPDFTPWEKITDLYEAIMELKLKVAELEAQNQALEAQLATANAALENPDGSYASIVERMESDGEFAERVTATFGRFSQLVSSNELYWRSFLDTLESNLGTYLTRRQ